MTFRPAASQWAKAAERMGPNAAVEMRRYVEALRSGAITTLDMPWPQLTKMTQALTPGGIVTICGGAGDGKSLLLQQMSQHVIASGAKGEMFLLEHPTVWHTRRLYAQLSGDWRLTDPAWLKSSNGHVAELTDPHDQAVTEYFYHAKTMNNGQATYRDLLDWLSEGAARGVRYFAIDPITGIKPPDKPWVADQEFLAEARKIVEQANASLALTTHPRKGRGKGTGLDDMANGAAFNRFTDCVLWLEKPEKGQPVKMHTVNGDYTTLANRAVIVRKASNGNGAGIKMGMRFDEKTFRYTELGVVLKDEQKAKDAGHEPYIAEKPPEEIANLFAPTPTKPWLQRQSDTAPGETA